jgi:phenylacetate-CoA ligase
MAAAANDYLERPAIEELQYRRLCAQLQEILPANRFYARKLAGVKTPVDLDSPAGLRQLPFTTKAELVADQQTHPPYGEILTYPLNRYCRLHQTSATSGRPLRWLDTPESWTWVLDCWALIYHIAGLTPDDRLFFPFSFGPFLGFWAAFEAATRLGHGCLPGGGMSSAARLRFLLEHEATVVLSTPTYALHLAEVARSEGLDLVNSPVRMLIVTGEPGGSIPATRGRIEEAWGAHVLDHSGMTEAGSLSIECPENPAGLHFLETECIVEVVDPRTAEPVPPGQTGELVLTNLGRLGSPLVRYRTGDLVRVDSRPCPCGRTLVRLEGGILGRTDDMIHVRGNNVYPSALEGVIRRFPEVAEFRIQVERSKTLPVLRVELEPVAAAPAGVAERVDRAIRDELLFRAEVAVVPPGTLPRFELKARRLVRN